MYGIFHYQYFMCYNIYLIWFVHDLFTITVRENNIYWTNAIDAHLAHLAWPFPYLLGVGLVHR